MEQKNSKGCADELVSVIIPIYNIEPYLRRCVDSVLAQTYRSLEIILVDDGSTDKCGEICDEYAARDNRIKVIHKENMGVAAARNSALDIMSGKYIACIDGDDMVRENYIEFLYGLIKEYGADVSICSINFIKDGKMINHLGKSKKPVVMDNKALMFQAVRAMLFSNSVCFSLFKREIFDNLRFPDGKIYEDIPTVLDAYLKCGRAVFCNNPLYMYIYREGSITKRDFEPEMLSSIYFAEEKLGQIVEKYPSHKKIAKCRMFDQYYEMLRLIKDKDSKVYKEMLDGLKSVRRTVVLYPYSGLYRRGKAVLSYFGKIVSI